MSAMLSKRDAECARRQRSRRPLASKRGCRAAPRMPGARTIAAVIGACCLPLLVASSFCDCSGPLTPGLGPVDLGLVPIGWE